jgi:hypothetical protein
MSDEDLLSEWLLAWEEIFEMDGKDVPAEELCGNRPDLVPELAARIARLKRIAWVNRPVEEAMDEPMRRSAQATGGQDRCEPSGSPRVLADRYRLDCLIGEGGFGRVWKGFDLQLQRPVAIKLPRSDRLAGPDQLAGLLAEAQRVAQLRHPGIVPVHDVGLHDKSRFIVSELIQGIDLGHRLRAGPVAVRETVRIVVNVADTLGYAHRQGIVHRDIKPANILLGRDGRVYVTDFGVALDVTGSDGDRPGIGTAAYMSPEQAVSQPAKRVDGRTDIYSLGVVFHELLTGRRPDPVGATVGIRSEPAVAPDLSGVPTGRDVPECLAPICRKCLSVNPADRYATGEELADALRNAVAGLLSLDDWFACTDTVQILSHLFNLERRTGFRKVRLFACACARHAWAGLTDEQSRRTVEVAERYADGAATDDDLRVARAGAWEVEQGSAAEVAAWTAHRNVWTAAVQAARLTPAHLTRAFLHDLFGPTLFRPSSPGRSWLPGLAEATRRLAEEIYERRSFERLPELAATLVASGCPDEEMIGHCRRPGAHVKGCWVLDELLGRGWPAPAGLGEPTWIATDGPGWDGRLPPMPDASQDPHSNLS